MLSSLCSKSETAKRSATNRRGGYRRRGKTLLLLAITLPTLCGMIGLVIDGGLLLSKSRQTQHVADSAATAAAMEKQHGQSNSAALAVAERIVHEYNALSSAVVTLNCPPTSGPYAGSATHVELFVNDQYSTYFIHILGGPQIRQTSVRATAGYEPSTVGAAIVVLDPNPPAFETSPLPVLPIGSSLPAIIGGLEILGVGTVKVHGAVLVNTEWGGKDENGQQVGEATGPQGLSHAVSATPMTSLSSLQARDIRVVGGVDDPNNYGPLNAGGSPPLKAGMLPVPDPLQDLPTPTTATNASSTTYGGKTVAGLPLIGPPVTLQPGVYDWIEVISGVATFQPGIYVIRGKNPQTQRSLSIIAGQVQATGVMFYITDSADFSPASGLPDSNDQETEAPLPSSNDTPPCAVINIGLLGSAFSGLSDPSSPFNEVFIYQRRHDRRPIILVQEDILGAGQMHGTIYSKWGHVVLAGKGTYDARFVVGTMRIIALLDVAIQPSTLLPPAADVYLVE